MKRRLFILLIVTVIICLIGSIYYFVFFPNNIIVPCLFHEITKLYCPGCGVTRMIISLLQFDFYQAFRYNALLFLALPFIVILVIDFIVKWVIGRKNYIYMKINNKIWWVLLILTILFGIVRNIPFFDYLIPTII